MKLGGGGDKNALQKAKHDRESIKCSGYLDASDTVKASLCALFHDSVIVLRCFQTLS